MSRVVSALGALLVVLMMAPASAQDRPVVFVHGINSDGSAWAAAAARLQAKLAIVADVPSLSSRALYETQASELQRAVGHRGGTTIAVGHSNGGVVSRQWSQQHPVSSIVTVGTPHGGAPIVSNMYAVAGFNGAMLNAFSDVYRRFAYGCCAWEWILSAYHGLWQTVASASLSSVGRIAGAVALHSTVPVTFEMLPGSGYLNGLNGAANLQREASQIAGRVGIVSTAYHFYWGGVLRAAFPDDGDTLYTLREMARIGLEVYGAYVYANAPAGDWGAFNIADAMLGVAGYLGAMDDHWCRAVSAVGFTACWVNDTIVPQWSQFYPGAGYIDTGWNGPAHTQQTRMSDALLEQALVVYAGVRPRDAGPPPQAPQVEFFEHVGFGGGVLRTSRDEAFVGWDWNDRISSVRVPAGRTVVLYEHADYGGASLTLSGDSGDLREHAGPGLDGTWNDVASSVQVR